MMANMMNINTKTIRNSLENVESLCKMVPKHFTCEQNEYKKSIHSNIKEEFTGGHPKLIENVIIYVKIRIFQYEPKTKY